MDDQAADPAQVPDLHSLQEFVAQGTASFSIGVELREDRRTLSDGEEADGLLIVKVEKGSPAAKAGLHALSRAAHNVMDGAVIAASMFFPPAILGIPILDGVHVLESYDMIIGVDGERVINVVDFQDAMSQVKAGDILYLSVVHNGKRKQIAVTIPADASAASGY